MSGWSMKRLFERCARAQFRRFSSQSSDVHNGLLEMREYAIDPGSYGKFLSLVEETADLRKTVLPVVGLLKCDIGGQLSSFTHFYHYKDLDHRDAARARASATPAWSQDYLPVAKSMMVGQQNAIYIPAVSILEAAGSKPISSFVSTDALLKPTGDGAQSKSNSPGMIEMRQYQLHPGYDTIPTIVSEFEKGIPHKIAASPDIELLFFGFTDIGMLNNVIEIWRYPSAAACIAARQQARKVQPWRETIGKITPKVQHFTSYFMYPVKGSPIY